MARRVFFSFHYQDVIDFRANTVRNHYLTKDNQAGYFDASLWESSKLKGAGALKNLIDDGLKNTSVTVVLIGSETYQRRWVQYEIMKSLEKGNKIIGIHINSIKCKKGFTKISGKDPFDYLGLKTSDGSRTLIPMIISPPSTQWSIYSDLGKLNSSKIHFEDQIYKLSAFLPIYDWVSDDGFNNFQKWIN